MSEKVYRMDNGYNQAPDLGRIIIRRGMIARRILDGVVKNKYRSNVGKLAAWLSASHVERPPKASTT